MPDVFSQGASEENTGIFAMTHLNTSDWSLYSYTQNLRGYVPTLNGHDTSGVDDIAYTFLRSCYLSRQEEGHLSYACPKNLLGERDPPPKKEKKKKKKLQEPEEP